MLDIYKRRMAAAGAGLEALGLDSLIVSEPAALFYLTGETIHPGERLTVLVSAKRSRLSGSGTGFSPEGGHGPFHGGGRWRPAGGYFL